MALQGIEVEGVIIKEYPAKEGVSKPPTTLGNLRNSSFRPKISTQEHACSVFSVQTAYSSSISMKVMQCTYGSTSMPVHGRTDTSMTSTPIAWITSTPMPLVPTIRSLLHRISALHLPLAALPTRLLPAMAIKAMIRWVVATAPMIYLSKR